MRRAALALVAATAGCGTRDHRPPPLAPPPEVDLAIVGVTVVHPGQGGAAAAELRPRRAHRRRAKSLIRPRNPGH